MDVKVVLVAADGVDKQTYLEELKGLDVKVKNVTSFIDLEKTLTSDGYNGIIVDLKTKLKATREEKELAYELIESFPVLQVRVDSATQKIHTLSFGKAKSCNSLPEFVTEQCPEFHPRRLRTDIRRKIHFNMILSKSGSFAPDKTIHTVSLNVSRGGSFVYSADDWSNCKSVVFIINELSESIPIVGEIRWEIPWGKSMRVPGIGIKFEDILESQLREIMAKARLDEF